MVPNLYTLLSEIPERAKYFSVMEIRLISIPYSSHNTKKVGREGWERRLEKEGGLEGELGKSSRKLGAGASPCFTAL